MAYLAAKNDPPRISTPPTVKPQKKLRMISSAPVPETTCPPAGEIYSAHRIAVPARKAGGVIASRKGPCQSSFRATSPPRPPLRRGQGGKGEPSQQDERQWNQPLLPLSAPERGTGGEVF